MNDLLALVRWVHFLSGSLLMGAVAFDRLIAAPALRSLDAPANLGPLTWQRTWRGLAVGSLVLASLSALAWLLVESAVMSGQPVRQAVLPPILGTVLLRTGFGRIWLLRLALFGLAGTALVRAHRRSVGPQAAVWVWILCGAASAAQVLVAWVGHAAASEGVARLPLLLADSVHLLATGLWFGGLVPLALFLRAQRAGPSSAAAAVQLVVHRFSALAFGCVAGLLITGGVNTWTLVGSVPALVGTPYGHLLLFKLALLGLVLGVAAVNRYRWVPALGAGGPAAPLGAFAGTVLLEAGVASGILLVVGFLGIAPPGAHVAPVWPFAVRLSWRSPASLPGGWVALLVTTMGVLGGLFALGYALLRRQHRLWALLLGLALLGGYGADARRFVGKIDAYPTTYLRSPIGYEVAAITHGQALYQAHCAVCHGTAGRGDGPAAQTLHPRPADLTGAHLGHHTAGDLFWWLTHGIPGTAMPGFAAQLTEPDRWDVVQAIRTLAAAAQAATLPSNTLWPSALLVAPDFAFETPDGTPASLRDARGQSVVLLVLAPWSPAHEGLRELQTAVREIGEAQVIVVPLGPAVPPGPDELVRLGAAVGAEDERQAIADTYARFLRPEDRRGVHTAKGLAEFLIDRRGYLRAAWGPGVQDGGADFPQLVATLRRLQQEPMGPSAPEEHTH